MASVTRTKLHPERQRQMEMPRAKASPNVTAMQTLNATEKKFARSTVIATPQSNEKSMSCGYAWLKQT